MTIVRQLLTNQAYGFPKGQPRRVKPVALACIHITGNSRTAAYTDLHAAAQAERNYANRSGNSGPSAHLYIARDGWGIEAIDATRHVAWSNGDVSSPNTSNPGIRRVLALRAKGYNANEAYWLEFECVGFPRTFPITEEQVQTVGQIIGQRARLSGLPINRETVHGHWEINGVDRQNCPDPRHEAFLDRVIAAATEDPMRPFPVTTDAMIAAIRPGAQLYLFDLTPDIDVSNAPGVPSPYGYRTGGIDYRVVQVATGGIPHLWLVKKADCTLTPVPEPPAPDCTDVVTAAVHDDRTKARIVWDGS